jgi:Outer membrane protein beta-barrel domain
MKVQTVVLSCLTFILLPAAFAQNFEISGHIGRQFNGGVDLSTFLYERIDVADSTNYGATAGYLLGEHFGAEFQWNHTRADTSAEPVFGGSSVKVFTLNQNQYMGNFVFHFTGREAKLRPFAFFGLGASSLSTNRSSVSGATRFAFALGGGAKYYLGKHFGLRGQAKWSPTYLTTTDGGYWCDPFWGGCWVVGNDHYLHEFDLTGGVILRF